MKGFKNVNVYVEGKGIVKTSIGFDNGINSSFTRIHSLLELKLLLLLI